jgi:catechol 2,3-dioxygenase-like lactoylglutathione lyase family enzyme
MKNSLALVSLVVRDYDEAIRFFIDALQFELIEDTFVGDGKRWVVVSPPGSLGTGILLAKADTSEQETRIGNQTGGRVFLFLHTGDFSSAYHHMKSHGVHFNEEPRSETYGKVAVFLDLYGNKWDLIEPKI